MTGSLGYTDANYITFRIDKQQGPNVHLRELYSTSCDKPQYSYIERMHIRI